MELNDNLMAVLANMLHHLGDGVSTTQVTEVLELDVDALNKCYSGLGIKDMLIEAQKYIPFSLLDVLHLLWCATNSHFESQIIYFYLK